MPYNQVYIHVAYEGQYRSISGPIIHTVTVVFAPSNQDTGQKHDDVVSAMKHAISDLKPVYEPFESFKSASGIVECHAEVYKEVRMRVNTPEKTKEPKDMAHDFCQSLVEALKQNEKYEEMKHAQHQHAVEIKEEEEKSIDFSGL